MSTTASGEKSTPRRPQRRVLVIALLAVAAVFVAAFAVGKASTGAPKPPSANVGTQLDSALPPNIATLPLLDEYGHTTNLTAFTGKTVVLNDFMTLCQEVCPITTAQLNQVDTAVRKAKSTGQVAFLNVTVDPERDTPARLHAYRSFADLPANWTLLTGTPANIAALWRYFGVSYSKTAEDNPPAVDWLTHKPLTYDVTHADVVTFLDATGHERFVLEGRPVGAGAPLTSGEAGFLNDEGHSNLTDNADANWTPQQALQVVNWLTKRHIHFVG